MLLVLEDSAIMSSACLFISPTASHLVQSQYPMILPALACHKDGVYQGKKYNKQSYAGTLGEEDTVWGKLLQVHQKHTVLTC